MVLLLGLRLGARAVRGLEDDEEDVFFETGRSTQALLEVLVSRGLQAMHALSEQEM